MQEVLKAKATELLENGTVSRVLGWKIGEFSYDITPAVFESKEEIEKEFIYNPLFSPNLSKYLVAESKKEGKILVFLKSCDSYSFNQLVTEHRIDKENVYAVGIPCEGTADMTKVREKFEGLLELSEKDGKIVAKTLYGDKECDKAEILMERCERCKSRKVVYFDELIGENGEVLESNRFDMVEKLEKMTDEERFAFWQNELSKCIRCNACRKVCPACTCEHCVFDNVESGVSGKANTTSFEEQLFHVIRAFHVAGRCTDCGECSRVCPQNIPLHLLNRKFILDINRLYGPYQAGEEEGQRSPLTNFTFDDAEPSVVREMGGEGNV